MKSDKKFTLRVEAIGHVYTTDGWRTASRVEFVESAERYPSEAELLALCTRNRNQGPYFGKFVPADICNYEVVSK